MRTHCTLLALCLTLTLGATTARAQVRWTRTALPDGSGALSLPAGWRITGAVRGMVSAIGPQGGADLGLWTPVYTPEAARMMWTRPPLVAAYDRPSRALATLFGQFARAGASAGLTGWRFDRVLSEKPVAWPGGMAAYLHYEWTMPRGGAAQVWHGLALVVMKPTGGGQWMYYTSVVSAPKERFAASLPVLLEIWASWKVSDRLIRRRLAEAARSLASCRKLIEDAAAFRKAVGESAFEQWNAYIRQ